MANQRSAGKKLIGAQASQQLWEAVDTWLERNPGKSVTDFLLNACVEKLHREGVEVQPDEALADYRMRRPASRGGGPLQENRVSSGEPSPAKRILGKAAGSVLKKPDAK